MRESAILSPWCVHEEERAIERCISCAREFRQKGRLVMKETAQEYTKRILGNVEGQDALKVQSESAKKIARLIRNAAPSKSRKRPAPDKWSVAEILAHLADCEIATARRVRQIVGAPGTPIQPFDQDS